MATFQDSQNNVDLIRAVPGNGYCVDCNAEKPEWASINLGVLMCLQCSGVHRSLGTHISKVRSLDLDVECWKGDLLEFMCSVGNKAFNKIWEYNVGNHILRPQHFADEDFVRQQFIRRKYDQKLFMPLSVIEPSNAKLWMRMGSVTKYGGKEHSLIHKWQKRVFNITPERVLTYSKSPDSPVLGSIDLTAPMQQFPSFDDGQLSKGEGYVFTLNTPMEGEHLGRKFVFRCDSELERLQWVESIRAAIDSSAALTCLPFTYTCLDDDLSPLETEIKSLIRSEYNTLSKLESKNDLILKEMELYFKFPQDTVWLPRCESLFETAF